MYDRWLLILCARKTNELVFVFTKMLNFGRNLKESNSARLSKAPELPGHGMKRSNFR